MDIENRPDLSQTNPEVRAYIDFLEAELDKLRQGNARRKSRDTSLEDIPLPEPTEPPTTINVITMTANGIAKRTPRHLYTRQRRSGMGIFDLDVAADTPPSILTVADESQQLVVITNQARAFPLRVTDLPLGEVRDKGELLQDWITLRPNEQIALAIPDLSQGYFIIVTKRGHVRRLRHHYFGSKLRPGTNLYTLADFGAPAGACWTNGEQDLLITTKAGKGIRFAERLVPANGCLGIRLGKEDEVAAAVSVQDESEVFMMSADGKGTIRQMSGFAMNKAPGAGGKVVMKTNHLVGAFVVNDGDDILAISQLSKIIRFQAIEVPPKTGVVQGVNCMALRSDEVTAMTGSALPTV